MTNIVYLNGDFVPEGESKVPLSTHALQYGTGCFEGIRAYKCDDGKIAIFRALDHFKRLHQSAKILKISIKESPEKLVEITKNLIKANNVDSDIYIRPLAFKSGTIITPQLNGVEDSMAIYLVNIGAYLDKSKPIKICTSTWRRVSDSMLPSRAKISGTYVMSALAKSEALDKGFDEAIFLTAEGKVSEGSGENVFIVKDDKVCTPPVSDSILEGITRAMVIEIIQKDLSIEVIERSIDRSELYLADEIFLTGTAAEITSVGVVDNYDVNNSKVGPITAILQKNFNDIVRGRLDNYKNYLTII